MNKSEIRIFVYYERRKQKSIIAFSKSLFFILKRHRYMEALYV